MSQVDKSNKIIVITVFVLDIIAINLFFLTFQTIWNHFFGVDIHYNNPFPVYVSLDISYLISSYISGILLYHRRIRIDQIILSTINRMIGFFIVWIILVTVNKNSEITVLMPYIYFFIYVTILFILLRLVYRGIIMLYRKQGRNQCNVIYLGSADSMQELYEEMSLRLTTGYRVIGYFDDEESEFFSGLCLYLGKCEEALPYLRTHKIDRVYCGLTSSYGKTIIIPIINFCENHLIRFYSIPNMRNYFHRRVTLEMFSNVPMLSIHNEPLSHMPSRVLKRTFDIVFSLLFLCTLFPVIYIVVAIITKITSPGPVLFKQKRNGINGKEFWCYKFRSMKVNVDADTVQATEDDPRKTKWGDFMRRTSIDELPQFLNVLKGDMSVVGPRPHMLKHTEEYSSIIDTYMVRHLVKPGVTGWAQVTGFRGETKRLSEMDGRVKADIWYLEHWTFMLDIIIIIRTVVNVIYKKDDKAY